MTKNPFYNAISALIYIVFIVLVMNFMSNTGVDTNTAQYIMPIIMLSLFTLSAAVMGYIFLLQPIRLYLENKKEEGISLFIKTILVFGGLTLLISISYLIYRL